MPKRKSQSTVVPTVQSAQKKKRVATASSELVAAISPEVLDTITKQVTERVTSSIKEELKALINNSASNNKISICSNNLGASQSNFEVLAQEQILQQSVETEVINHAEKITGKCLTGFVSTAVPIDARVSDQIKSKIWSNQLIEFKSLLSKEKQKKGKFSLQVEEGDDVGKITIYQLDTESQNEVSVASMHDWLTAWNRFSAIYCIRYPDQQAMLA